jgi:hypothetical protein
MDEFVLGMAQYNGTYPLLFGHYFLQAIFNLFLHLAGVSLLVRQGILLTGWEDVIRLLTAMGFLSSDSRYGFYEKETAAAC